MYSYTTERPKLFTEDGVRMLLTIRDNMRKLCKESGAVRFFEAMTTGDSWMQLACADYLVERGDIRRVTTDTAGQDQVFVWNRTGVE